MIAKTVTALLCRCGFLLVRERSQEEAAAAELPSHRGAASAKRRAGECRGERSAGEFSKGEHPLKLSADDLVLMERSVISTRSHTCVDKCSRKCYNIK